MKGQHKMYVRFRATGRWAEAAPCVVRPCARCVWYVSAHAARGTSMCTLCVVHLCARHGTAAQQGPEGWISPPPRIFTDFIKL